MAFINLTNNIKQFKEDKFNLITAPTGNGKTTAIVRDLGIYCKQHNKSILYLVPRASLKEQLEYDYHDIDEKLIKFRTFQWLGTYMNHGFYEHYDYIVIDEAHSLLTNATYDFSCYKIINYINRTKNTTFIALSATPAPIIYMLENNSLQKPLNEELNAQTYDNSTVGDIYLVRNQEDLFKMHEKDLKKGYKVLNFTNDTDNLDAFKRAYKGWECACILSKWNDKARKYSQGYNKAAYLGIIEQRKIICDHVTTTTVFEVGVSIEQESNFLVSFEGNYMPYTIEQCKSRIRKVGNIKVDMVFQIKNKKSSYQKITDCNEKLEEFEKMYKQYGTFENILLNDKENTAPEDSYERFNHVARLCHMYNLEFFSKQYYSESQEQFYVDMLQEMYPNKRITMLESKDLFDLPALLETYMQEGIGIIAVDEIPAFREQLKGLKLDKKNPNRAIGLSNLKKHLLESNLPYEVTADYKGGKKWILKRI